MQKKFESIDLRYPSYANDRSLSFDTIHYSLTTIHSVVATLNKDNGNNGID
jgi:hypothetical protein